MRLNAALGTMVRADAKEKGNPMDVETRLQELESDLHRTKVHAWTLPAIVLLLLILILLRVADSREWIVSIMVVLALAASRMFGAPQASGCSAPDARPTHNSGRRS